MLRIVVLFMLFVALLVWIAMLLRRAISFDIKLLISMMLFAAMGYALLDEYGSGWAAFGAAFGLLIGIEIKERFYKTLQDIYKDLTKD
ncbi:MAG: hypothetical protein HF962_07615 [Sulfurovum sp.]|nr:hypothetical protein [Sulfurovum sp.]